MRKNIRFLLFMILMFSIFAIGFATPADRSEAGATDYVTLGPDMKRSDVETRARTMANMQWTVKSNHQMTTEAYVTIPSYVRNAEVGDILVGIPYCWGGFNGLDTCGNYTKFSEIVLSNSQTAGNINTLADGHQAYTIGLDCSGFVSSAYGLSTHINARGLQNYGNAISYNDLKPMDFICKPGEHVVLYLSEYVDSDGEVIFNIIDSSVETGKVKTRTKPKKYYTERGYVCYTPWKPQCTYQTEYDTTYHYNECTDCGYESIKTHTFSYSDSDPKYHNKRCTGCVYTARERHNFVLDAYGQARCRYCGYTNGTSINNIFEFKND